jgi:predicted ATPase/DNA-binding XRE family transcriptional regulator
LGTEPANRGIEKPAVNERAEFSVWLRKRRRELDLTQEELAELVGCSRDLIKKIELAQRRPSRQMAELLAEHLIVPIEQRPAFVQLARSTQEARLLTLVPTAPRESGKLPQAPTGSLNNLPAPVSSFIGREKELAAVREILSREDVRLLTLTGPGGTGKTRLALQAASGLADKFADGLYFIELAPLAIPALVTYEIAQALGIREASDQPLLNTLKEYLKNRHICFLLDNYERLIEAAGLVGELLQAAPSLKVLVTSRVPLHIRGEKQFNVPPLHLPDSMRLPPLEQLTRYEAVRLFIERATDVKSDFMVTNDNASIVAQICARLDGLPLAIELAAAHIKFLSPQAILLRFQRRLRELTGGARDAHARHQSLHNTLEWSHELLSVDEQTLFRRLAVSRGGWSLEAVEAICDADGDIEIDVTAGIFSLADKSLLRQEEGVGGEPRFTLLETISEFAHEKLEESGEMATIRRQHALYFMALAEEAETQVTGSRQLEWLDRLEEEYDNFRTALLWARETGEGRSEGPVAFDEQNRAVQFLALETGLRTAGAIYSFWGVRGNYSEGIEHLSGLLFLLDTYLKDHADATLLGNLNESKAKALNGAGYLALKQGDQTASHSLFAQALEVGRSLGHKQSIATSLRGLGGLATNQDDPATARALLEESLALSRELGDKYGVALALHSLGNVAFEGSDFTTARSLYEESLALRRELGDKRGVAYSLDNLGLIASAQGDYPTARALHEESLALERELGDKYGVASTLYNLGALADREGDYASARSLVEECLLLFRALGNEFYTALTLHGLGIVSQHQGDLTRGAELLREASRVYQQYQHRLGVAYVLVHLGNGALAEDDTAEACRQYRESLPVLMEFEIKWVIAESLEGLACAAQKEGQAERAARLFGAADTTRQSAGVKLYAFEKRRHEIAVEANRTILGDNVFHTAWKEGAAMSIEEAVEYALSEG